MYTTRESATRAVTTPFVAGFGQIKFCPEETQHVYELDPGAPMQAVDPDHSNCILSLERCTRCAARRAVTEGPQDEMDDLYGPWEFLNPSLGEPHKE